MTAEDVLTAVRKNLADTNPIQERWTNGFLFKYLYEALLVTYQKRSDLFLSSDTISEPVEPTALDDILELGDDMRDALGYYTSYRALMEDNADAGNVNQANEFLKMYTARLGI